MSVPIDLIPVGDGRRPGGDFGPAFYVSRGTLERYRRRGWAEKYDDVRFVECAVAQPDAIFEGLKRQNYEGCFCYSVRPESDPDDDANDYGLAPQLPRYGQVFLAYVRLGDMGYVVFDWEWREEGEVPGHPANQDHDFERQIWPPN